MKPHRTAPTSTRSRGRSGQVGFGVQRRLAQFVVAACCAAAGVGVASGAMVGTTTPGIALQFGGEQITSTQLSRQVARQRAQAVASGSTFPKRGTSDFAAIRRSALEELFLTRVYHVEAVTTCGEPCSVTPAELADAESQLVKGQFGGDRRRFATFLAKRKYALREARVVLRSSGEREKLYSHIAAGATFTDDEARRYYEAHLAEYQARAGRRVYHILVERQGLAAQISAQANADNFGALAKQYSTDPGSRNQSGDLGLIQKGAFVPEFEAAALRLADGEISRPVKSQFGWHVIRAVLQPASTKPFDEVKAEVIATQSQAKQQDAFKTWNEATVARYRSGATYASVDLLPAGVAPPNGGPAAP